MYRASYVPRHTLPLFERALTSLASTSEASSADITSSAASAAAKQLAHAITGMTKSRSVFVAMPNSMARRLTCALAALSSLCSLKLQGSDSPLGSDDAVLPHLDAAVDSLLDPMSGHLAAANKLNTEEQARCLHNVARCLQSAEPLVALRSAIGGSNVRTRLRGLLAFAAKHVTSNAAGNASQWLRQQHVGLGHTSGGRSSCSKA